MLCRNHREEYATFRGCWKGVSQKWFHVDIHGEPQWLNKHLLLMLVENKRKEPEITPRLEALVKWVIELRRAELEACHCTEEFTLQRICPLGHWEKFAFECSQLTDPNSDPLDTDNLLACNSRGHILNLPWISFCLAVMKIPNPRNLMSHLIRKG
jgi:hypothetical protein